MTLWSRWLCSGLTCTLSRIYTFVNNINTHDGGTHLTGFRNALTRLMNDYAKRMNHVKEADGNFIGEDVREGLTAIISVKVLNLSLRDRPSTARQREVQALRNSRDRVFQRMAGTQS